MKVRDSFVTNSSSASFIVYKKHITPLQTDMLLNHILWSRIQGWDEFYNESTEQWNLVKNDDDVMEFSTYMDNFDLEEFAIKIGLSKNAYRMEKD